MAVSDEEILSAWRFLATKESVFCEAASAASVAGLLKVAREGGGDTTLKGSHIVCILTGHGLKDPDLAISNISVPVVVEPELSAVLKEMDL
jgi:threonine synthase